MHVLAQLLRDRFEPLNPWKARTPKGAKAARRKARKVSRDARRRSR